MLLQVAAQDIGQLTDIQRRRVFPRSLPRLGCPAPWLAVILRRLPGLYLEGQRVAGMLVGVWGTR